MSWNTDPTVDAYRRVPKAFERIAAALERIADSLEGKGESESKGDADADSSTPARDYAVRERRAAMDRWTRR